ncbi:MAG: glycosyltransferase family 4 protein [Thermoplasmata archaeon]
MSFEQDPHVASRAEGFTLVRRRGCVRLVLSSHSYFPAVGGVERLIQGLAEGAAQHGIDTFVVTRQDPGTLRREELHGVTIVRIPMVRVGGFHVPRDYLSTLRDLRPDVLHLSGNRVWSADFYLPFAGTFGWAQVMTGHGFYQYEMHRRPWDTWYFENYLPGRIRHFEVYAASIEHERTQLVNWGVAPGRIELVPDGIALEEFNEPRSDPAVVRARWGLKSAHFAFYAGGFYENKRVDRLVRAVAATGGTWGLVATGRDLPDSPCSRERVSRLAAEARAPAVFRDVVPRSEFLDSISAADVVVLGSSYEGFGLFLLEAMAMGRPFVAYRTGAVPELAAQGAGFCVDSEPQFLEALRRLEDPGLRAQMGARGREVVRDYSIEKVVGRYLAVYERAIAAHKDRAGEGHPGSGLGKAGPLERGSGP